jgi:YVTN family beta-propeller protein
LKQLRHRYEEVLAEHQRLLRSASAAHGGHEVDTQGDAFFFVFSSARDALLAAAEGQLSLLSHEWPHDAQVKVRMGIHTGQAAERNGTYTGLAVHRAARICATGHGSQILLSHATQTLLEDEEEDIGISFRDIGEHRLKDLDRPVRLYQAKAAGLPAEFPPLRSSGEPAQGVEDTISEPPRRRRIVIAALGVTVAAAVAVGAFLLVRGNGSSAGAIPPNHLGVIDPETNKIVGDVRAGSGPGALATGSGSVWVANTTDRTIMRFSATRRVRTATISLKGRTPTGLSYGAGALWIAHGFRGQLSRLEPRSSRIATIDVADPGANRGAVTAAGRSVWVVYGDSTLARIDPKAMHVEGATFAGASPSGVVVANGLVWVLNSGDRTVTRFRPATFEGGAVGRPIRVGRKPAGIAAGEGAIWVTDAGDDAVTRIDPLTNATSTIHVGREPTGVTVGGGLVWVANTGSGTVSRIDPVSNEVVATIDVGNAPAGVVFDGDVVWVSVQGA